MAGNLKIVSVFTAVECPICEGKSKNHPFDQPNAPGYPFECIVCRDTGFITHWISIDEFMVIVRADHTAQGWT